MSTKLNCLASSANNVGGASASGISAARAWVETVTVRLAGLVPSNVIADGETVHVVAGAVEQSNVSSPANPAIGVAVTL
jgi:hypothetical protein